MVLSPVSGGHCLGGKFVRPCLTYNFDCFFHSSYSYRDSGYNATSSEVGDGESERAYDPVGDRVPGNPLFPSNFAHLALGPTLHAKYVCAIDIRFCFLI